VAGGVPLGTFFWKGGPIAPGLPITPRSRPAAALARRLDLGIAQREAGARRLVLVHAWPRSMMLPDALWSLTEEEGQVEPPAHSDGKPLYQLWPPSSPLLRSAETSAAGAGSVPLLFQLDISPKKKQKKNEVAALAWGWFSLASNLGVPSGLV